MPASELFLTGSELLMHRAHQELNGKMVPVMFVRLQGAMEAKQLSDAVVRLSRRYPQLAARVTPHGRRCRFELPASPLPVSREIVTRQHPCEWVTRAQRQTRQMFDTASGPLLRVEALIDATAGETDLLLAAHHALLDGFSLVQIIRDLVDFIETAADSIVEPPRPWSRPGQIARRGTRSRSAFRTLAGMLYQLVRRGLSPIAKIPLRSPLCEQVQHRRLDVDLTTQLVLRARENGTTVTGVLIAAMFQGLACLDTRRKTRLGAIVLNSARPWYEPPITKDALGMFISFIHCWEWDPAHTPFWTLAARCREHLTRHLDNNSPANLLKLADRLVPLMPKMTPQGERWRRAPYPQAVINNLGVVPEIRSPSGAIHATELAWLSNPEPDPQPVALYAATLNGRLNLLFTSHIHSADEFPAFIDGYLARIRTAIDDTPH